MEKRKSAECAICIDIYRNPHMLGCGHTFCKNCIDGLRKEMIVKCPLCNSESDVNGVKSNYALAEVLRSMEQMEASGTSIRRPTDCTIEMKDVMNRGLDILKDFLKGHGPSLNKFKEEMCSLQRHQTITLKKASELRHSIIDEINSRFDALDTEIIQLFSQQIKKLQEYCESQCEQKEKLEECLRELEETIYKRDEDLATAGEIMVAEAKQLVESFTHELFTLNPFPLEPAATMPNMSVMLCRKMTSQKSVMFECFPNSLRLIDDQLWQCHYCGISVYTLDLELLRQIPFRDMGGIYDVMSTARDEVVVCAERGLYIIKKNC